MSDEIKTGRSAQEERLEHSLQEVIRSVAVNLIAQIQSRAKELARVLSVVAVSGSLTGSSVGEAVRTQAPEPPVGVQQYQPGVVPAERAADYVELQQSVSKAEDSPTVR